MPTVCMQPFIELIPLLFNIRLLFRNSTDNLGDKRAALEVT